MCHRLNVVFLWGHWIWKYLLYMVAISFQYASTAPNFLETFKQFEGFGLPDGFYFCVFPFSKKWYLIILLMTQTLIREKIIIIALSPLDWVISIRFSRKLNVQVVPFRKWKGKNSPLGHLRGNNDRLRTQKEHNFLINHVNM